jgi:hypothetical protein
MYLFRGDPIDEYLYLWLQSPSDTREFEKRDLSLASRMGLLMCSPLFSLFLNGVVNFTISKAVAFVDLE